MDEIRVKAVTLESTLVESTSHLSGKETGLSFMVIREWGLG